MTKAKKRHYPYDELSDRTCETKGCERRLKQRMVDLRGAKLCYGCWRREHKTYGRSMGGRRDPPA